MASEIFTTAPCPMTRTMGMIGTKWKPVIIYTIGAKAIRFGQIAARMPLISRKVLAEQLKELEEDGIVIRTAYGEVPPRVEYNLTEKGLALMPIFKEMCNWSRKFTDCKAQA